MSTNVLETIDQEITDLFKDVTQVMWNRLAPILGLVTTQHLFRQAVSKNQREFPWLSAVELTEEGPRFGEPDGDSRPADQTEIRKGLAAIVNTVLEILTVLTGDILTRDLQASVEEYVQRASNGTPQTVSHDRS